MMLWRFRRLIEAHGADPDRWPPPDRAGAEALLARSAAARAALAAARRLDALLAADVKPAAGEALAARIVARAAASAQERPVGAGRARQAAGWTLPRLWPQAVGLIAAALLGFAVGWANLLPPGLGGGETVDLSDLVAGAAALEEPLP
jgi:hypothetical protein